MSQSKAWIRIRRLTVVVISSFIFALNINSFVNTGNLFPGGATGLALLIQRLVEMYFSVHLPFTLINVVLNAFPVYIGFRYIGKEYTVYSCIMVLLTSVLTDLLPAYVITYDILLISIFGGIISGFGISLCLLVDASTGGTDFIAMYLSEKKGVDSWNLIFGLNAGIIVIAGFIYGWDRALYSIIFQFVCTQVIHLMYQEYQQKTLLIVTNNPEEVCWIIKQMSQHSATVLSGEGSYEGEERSVVFSVIGSRETNRIVKSIREKDPTAFIDIMKTDRVAGRFSFRHFS